MGASATIRTMLLIAMGGSAIFAAALPAQCEDRVLPARAGAPVVLDRAVAVVNNRVVLASDIANELRLSVLDSEGGGAKPTARQALDQLISRDLIQQQIRQEEARADEPSSQQIQDRLAALRKELPACVRLNCTTDTGWAAFLKAYGLTQNEVENYLRLQLEILAFIETRFRQGIRISQEEIETYYRYTLLPQYLPGQATPSLDEVAPRISEILLQQQVNVLFDTWLDNLRKQGDVEVLDPALRADAAPEARSEVSK